MGDYVEAAKAAFEIVVITFYSGINDFIKDSTLIHLFRLSFSTINIKHFNKLSSPELVWIFFERPSVNPIACSLVNFPRFSSNFISLLFVL